MTTILLVEDDTTIADLVRETLADEGYQVVCAAHGRLGLQALAAVAPALVICDLMMPVMDGPAFCRALRADPRFGALPIIVTSAIPVPPDVRDLASAVIGKPFRLDGLQAIVAGVIGLDGA